MEITEATLLMRWRTCLSRSDLPNFSRLWLLSTPMKWWFVGNQNQLTSKWWQLGSIWECLFPIDIWRTTILSSHDFVVPFQPVLDQTAEISLPICCLVHLVGFFRWINHDRTAHHFLKENMKLCLFRSCLIVNCPNFSPPVSNPSFTGSAGQFH